MKLNLIIVIIAIIIILIIVYYLFTGNISEKFTSNETNVAKECKNRDPSHWGPGLWSTIHTIAAGADTQEKREAFKIFVESLCGCLPCDKCRIHLDKNLDKLPIDNYMVSNVELFKWSWMLHNIVNKSNGKKEFSYEEAQKVYLK